MENADAEQLVNDLAKEAFSFLDEKPPQETKIKQYFGLVREQGDGDSQSERSEIVESPKPPDPVTEGKVLEPEHPLLVKFQQALKDHLQKQIDHVKNELFEYETSSKKTDVDREALGVRAYESQQIVSKQQGEIDKFVEELETITAVKEETEYRLREDLEKYKKEKSEEFDMEKKEIELRKEVESTNLLLQQIRDWESDLENEIKTNQRILDKTKKDKVLYAKEKRDLDMMMYRLTSEVWKLEGELETILMQLRVKEEEREKLAINLSSSNTDIETTQSEHRCLIRGWHSVVVAISARDKHYNQIYQDLEKESEKIRSLASEIQQIKKLSQKEMTKNESLTQFKSRIEFDMRSCEKQFYVENQKRLEVEKIFMGIQSVVEQTERDLRRVTAENHVRDRQYRSVFHEIQKYDTQKMQLEEQIMEALQDRITNDKAAKYLAKTLREVRARNRELEIGVNTIENKNTRTIMDVETQKRVNSELAARLKEMTAEQREIEERLTSIVEQSERMRVTLSKKEREVHMINRKLEQLVARIGDTEKSPYELKISALEQLISSVQEKNKELQKFWLREQGHVVNLSEKRQQQIHDSNILRKQTMILQQRNFKVNDELDGYRKQEAEMERLIGKLQNQLLYYTERLGRRKNSKEYLDESNDVIQSDYSSRLKDLEIEVIKLLSDIQDIQSDIEQMNRELLDRNRESLEWEKHFKMLLDTKKNIKDAKGEGGEVGNMRVEIHRMRVRYGQLKKAQDKLMYDLDHCISRRDAIVTNAEAREKRIKGTQSRFVFARKLDDTRNKLKQLQNEVENLENSLTQIELDIRRAEEKVESKKQTIESVCIKAIDVREKIEEEKTEKQMKLDLLVLNQRKLKIYVELSKGRIPYMLYKTESRIDSELTKHKDINDRLQRLAEDLLDELPEHKHVFLRMLNTLKLSVIV